MPTSAGQADTGTPPPPGADAPPPPPPFTAAGQAPPPWYGAGTDSKLTFTREYLVRPSQGRYVAGVCAALGRATNTDPVLWRVVIAVLGFFGGIGILIYLIGWLTIPGEGDTGSPLESVLGRGRSRMSPISVVLLGVAAAVTFAFIVNDGFRAALLGGAILVGGVLLLRRNNAAKAAAAPPTAGAPVEPPSDAAFPGPAPAYAAPAAYAPPMAYAAPGQSSPGTAPSGQPVTAPPPPTAAGPGAGVPPTIGMPFAPPPPSGYRPPFAPHGPWAGPAGAAGPQPYQPGPMPPAVRPPKPPKPPRERSKLGRITFFLIPVAIGLVALLDLIGVPVRVSTYFAATLATIALGLVVGAWFGRARGLIALALLATIGLGISSANERWGTPLNAPHWRPLDVTSIADTYNTPLGDATLDLRAVDFTGQQQATTVRMNAGRLQVMLPPTVDATVTVDVGRGRVRLFDNEWNGRDIVQQATDQGVDRKVGGGDLRLNVVMEAGDVEVVR